MFVETERRQKCFTTNKRFSHVQACERLEAFDFGADLNSPFDGHFFDSVLLSFDWIIFVVSDQYSLLLRVIVKLVIEFKKWLGLNFVD
jgi:hypothetical protein